MHSRPIWSVSQQDLQLLSYENNYAVALLWWLTSCVKRAKRVTIFIAHIVYYVLHKLYPFQTNWPSKAKPRPYNLMTLRVNNFE